MERRPWFRRVHERQESGSLHKLGARDSIVRKDAVLRERPVLPLGVGACPVDVPGNGLRFLQASPRPPAPGEPVGRDHSMERRIGDPMVSLLFIAISTHARGDRPMAQKKPTVYEFIPKLGQLRDDVLFGDIWEHPDLSKRDRSLITVAMLAALYRTDEMRGHMQRALDNGVTETELKGLITHVAFYAGWPCAVNAGRIAIDVFGPK